ncbi:MAG: glycosyltransferase family 4 protein, partial [Propionibacteriaceae bacterium]|nr:glycosyltransferase family 4 protein [Propionibacteriaceae bacterium]
PVLRDRVVVVPVGAQDEWFAAGQAHLADDDEASASLIFYGLFTPLQGVPTIARALAILHDRDQLPKVTLLGSGQDYDEVRSILEGVPVTWREWVPAEELPDFVASHDICLGIVGTTAKAQRVVPNKVYQGMAAGCAVITSETPAQTDVLGDGACFVPPGDPQALADAISMLSSDHRARRSLAKKGYALASQKFSRRAVVADLMSRLERR